tara:strand:- start:262 stop:417 length:156 start_codon:yes stop_codon:yes gene_type:complete
MPVVKIIRPKRKVTILTHYKNKKARAERKAQRKAMRLAKKTAAKESTDPSK